MNEGQIGKGRVILVLPITVIPAITPPRMIDSVGCEFEEFDHKPWTPVSSPHTLLGYLSVTGTNTLEKSLALFVEADVSVSGRGVEEKVRF